MRSCEEVIQRNICSRCGSCIAVCPSGALSWRDEEVIFDRSKCIECGLCLKVCPFVNPNEIPLAKPMAYLSARTRIPEVAEQCQDGGVVTTLLIRALESGMVDEVLATASCNNVLFPVPIIARSHKELLKTCGSKYAYSPVLSLLRSISRGERIAIVGLPCQITALRLMEKLRLKATENVRLAIGLFCFQNYTLRTLADIGLRELLDVRADEVKKLSIRGGKIIAWTVNNDRKEAPIAPLDAHALPACKVCQDFVASLADISVGSTGSPEGWSTVIIWNEKGEEAFRDALEAGYLRSRPLGEEGIKRINRLRRIKARRALKYIQDNPELRALRVR